MTKKDTKATKNCFELQKVFRFFEKRLMIWQVRQMYNFLLLSFLRKCFLYSANAMSLRLCTATSSTSFQHSPLSIKVRDNEWSDRNNEQSKIMGTLHYPIWWSLMRTMMMSGGIKSVFFLFSSLSIFITFLSFQFLR